MQQNLAVAFLVSALIVLIVIFLSKRGAP